MQIGVFDLINAKERELQTEQNFIENLRNYWIARFDLERALVGPVRPASDTALTPPNSTSSTTESL
jgi:hypothetical protein